MKTTPDIDDALLAGAKSLAACQGIPPGRFSMEEIRLHPYATAAAASADRSMLPIFNGISGLAPRLDGLDNKALRDAAGDDA